MEPVTLRSCTYVCLYESERVHPGTVEATHSSQGHWGNYKETNLSPRPLLLTQDNDKGSH